MAFRQIVAWRTAAERIALPACGRAGILLGNRKNSKPEKCLKMAQNPTRQVHAVLGAFSLEVTSTLGYFVHSNTPTNFYRNNIFSYVIREIETIE